MAAASPKMTREHAKRTKALKKALEDYLEDLTMLRSERDALIRRFMARIEREHIEDLRAALKSL